MKKLRFITHYTCCRYCCCCCCCWYCCYCWFFLYAETTVDSGWVDGCSFGAGLDGWLCWFPQKLKWSPNSCEDNINNQRVWEGRSWMLMSTFIGNSILHHLSKTKNKNWGWHWCSSVGYSLLGGNAGREFKSKSGCWIWVGGWVLFRGWFGRLAVFVSTEADMTSWSPNSCEDNINNQRM